MVSGHLQEKKGYYYAVLSYYDNNKKRHVKYFSTGLPVKGNKRKAEKILHEMQSSFEIPREIGEFSSDMLFADFLLRWLPIVKTRVRTTTYDSYEYIINSKVEPFFRKEKVLLNELQPFQIQKFYTDQLEKVKPNTVIRYHAVIHSALKYAVKTDLIPQNIAEKVDRPKKNTYEHMFLTEGELQRLFEAVKGTNFELPVLVAAFYGLRRGEILGLKWDAIDFEQGTITIKRTVIVTTVNGKKTIKVEEATKTKSSMRTFPLTPSFKEYFQRVQESQLKNKEVCGNCYDYEFDGHIFVDEMGHLIKPDYLTNEFPKLMEQHGIRRIRFHDLRHSCASFLLANGATMKEIQEWMGHSDYSTTADIYAHLDPSAKLVSAMIMEKGLNMPDAADFDSKW